jgi:hypothetical protein
LALELQPQLGELGPELSLLGLNSKSRATIYVYNNTALSLADGNGRERIRLNLSDSGFPMLTFYSSDGALTAFLNSLSDNVHLGLQGPGGSINLEVADKTFVRIGKDGFATNIGNSDLVTTGTGETRRTSAASVVLFGNKGDVIWRAP